jgi:Tfp pilus assembly protein PilV
MGMSMVEGLVSILIVGVVFTAVLDMLAATKLGQSKTSYRKVANLLAHDLMAEILCQDYEDNDEAKAFGRELAEKAGSRADFDDVDDYLEWSASPPQNKDGTEVPNRTGWRRSVDIRYADSTDITQMSVADSGIKHIIVTVAYNDVELARLVAIRAGAADRHLRDPTPIG